MHTHSLALMATHNAHSGNCTHSAMLQESMVSLPPTSSAASHSHGCLPTDISMDDHIEVLNSPSLPGTLYDTEPPSLLNGISASPAPMDVNLDELHSHVEGDSKPNEYVDQPCSFAHRHSTMQDDNIAVAAAIPTNINGERLLSLMCSDTKANKRNPSPLLDMCGFKKPKLALGPLHQQDFADISNAPLDDEGVLIDGAYASKDLAFERNRRQRLKGTFHSLRAAMPKISKMDKVSIVSDAICYVQDLQNQVEILERDIRALQACRHGYLEGSLSSVEDDMDSMVLSPMNFPEQKIMQLDVSKMEEQTYHLKIQCEKAPGVLVQLTRVFEELGYEIINAVISSVSDHILNTIVMKVKNEEVLEVEEMKNMLLKVASKFGLSL
eukprot:c23749_g1_i1 orf=588-1733(-)